MSSPERFALSGVSVALAASAWPTITDTTGLGIPCPLRTLTNIPCPFCGMTTASISLVRGDLLGAATANPLVIPITAFSIAVLIVMALRFAGYLGLPQPWRIERNRITHSGIAIVAVASWVFQLNRFGFI